MLEYAFMQNALLVSVLISLNVSDDWYVPGAAAAIP